MNKLTPENVTQERLDELVRAEIDLICLENSGVDNWEEMLREAGLVE